MRRSHIAGGTAAARKVVPLREHLHHHVTHAIPKEFIRAMRRFFVDRRRVEGDFDGLVEESERSWLCHLQSDLRTRELIISSVHQVEMVHEPVHDGRCEYGDGRN